MDVLNAHSHALTFKPYHSAIKKAIELAQKKMNRYYSRTDESHIYRIAMVLHPGLKVQYFRKQKWLEEWIETAKALTREAYDANYKKETSPVDPTRPTKRSPFGNFSVAATTDEDELDAYLGSRTEPLDEDEDPYAAIKWWTMKKHIYPNLHRMALDYLSIPGLSSYHVI